jgi:hypothetical protein
VKYAQNDGETREEMGPTEELARDMAYRDFLSHHPGQIRMALQYEDEAWVHYETDALERLVEEQGDLGLKSDEEINRILAEEEAKEAANGGEMTPGR